MSELIDRIQNARVNDDGDVFSSILNDLMVELGWTEKQAADRLDTAELTISKWMAGRAPTHSVREGTYQVMLCCLAEQEAINEMSRGGSGYGRDCFMGSLTAFVIGVVVIVVGVIVAGMIHGS